MEKLIKNRHFLWIAGAVLFVIYNAPSCRTLIPYPQSHPHVPVPAKAVPATPAGVTVPPTQVTASAAPAPPSVSAAGQSATTSAADANVSFANFYGNWQGRTALPRHRLCTLTFELRESHAADRPYAGYSSLTCTPFWPFEPGRHKPDPATVFMALKPMSAILSGAPEGGSILFRVDKTLGDNCPMTGLTLTPFGIKQIAVQWEDTLCGGGYMVLSKVR